MFVRSFSKTPAKAKPIPVTADFVGWQKPLDGAALVVVHLKSAEKGEVLVLECSGEEAEQLGRQLVANGVAAKKAKKP